MAVPAENKRYTYADYLAWDTDERIELIEGVPYALASPSDVHQSILFEFGRQLGNALEGKPCRVYPAPFDVRLFEGTDVPPEEVDTVIQPDLMVVCDRTKVDRKGVHGAPDFVLEVLSPSTARHDRIVKLNLYQQAGVREYWVLSPEERTAQVFLSEGGYLRPHELYTSQDTEAELTILEGCVIDLSKVFFR